MGVQAGTGLASGIDTNAVIEQLMKSEKRPVEKMLGQKKYLQAKISSYGNILNTMSALKKSMSALTATSLLSATSSDEKVVTATAENGATKGSHTIKVNSIATSHSIYSGIFTNANAQVTEGDKLQKLMIQVGQGDKLQLTVDKTNNTLSKLSKAINDAKVGVKTMIVNVGDVFTINGSNGEIDFSDGTDNKTATLKEGSYTGEELAKEIARVLNEAGGTDKFDASYDATSKRFKIFNYDENKDITLQMDEESPMAKIIGLKTDEEIVLKKGGGGVMSDWGVNGIEGFRLVVTADAQGALNTITIKVDEKGDGKYEDDGKDGEDADMVGLSRLAFNPESKIKNMFVAAEAKDAEIEFDGYKITRNSNKITNLTDGVTINLIAPSEGKAVQLNIDQDVKKMQEGIAAFAEAYNTVMELSTELSEAPQPGDHVILGGESTVRSVMSSIKGVFSQTFDGKAMAAIGLRHQKNTDFKSLAPKKKNEKGQETQEEEEVRHVQYVLGLDTKLFDKAVAEDPKLVSKMFEDMTKALSGVVDDYTQKKIPLRKDGLTKEIKRVDDQVQRSATRLTKLETDYRGKFSRLEQSLSKLQHEGDYLNQALAGMSGGSGKGEKK